MKNHSMLKTKLALSLMELAGIILTIALLSYDIKDNKMITGITFAGIALLVVITLSLWDAYIILKKKKEE